MVWPFGKKPERRETQRVTQSAIPRDLDRAGPVPPPPRTAHPPAISLHTFAEVPSSRLLRLGSGKDGFFLEGEERKSRSLALLVLQAGDSTTAGDVLLWSPSLPLEELSRTSPGPQHHFRRDGLAGRGVSGITGLRTLHAGGGITVLRLGPPPGARWVFVGLSAIAVFSGQVTLVDGDESRLVPAGRIALVGDPTATLYFEAGNDSALSVALGGANVVSALG